MERDERKICSNCGKVSATYREAEQFGRCAVCQQDMCPDCMDTEFMDICKGCMNEPHETIYTLYYDLVRTREELATLKRRMRQWMAHGEDND